METIVKRKRVKLEEGQRVRMIEDSTIAVGGGELYPVQPYAGDVGTVERVFVDGDAHVKFDRYHSTYIFTPERAQKLEIIG